MGSFASFSNSSIMSHRLGHVLNTSAKQSLNAYGQLSWSAALLSSANTRESVLLRQTLQSRNVKSLAMGQLVRRTLHSLRTIAVNFASNLKDHTQNAKWRQLSRSSEATAGNAKDSNEKASSNRGLGYLEPLPEPLHAVLPPETIGNGRVIIVGDIHGCHDEFVLLMEMCECRPEDIVVLVGDLGNKGPKSAETVALARGMGAWAVRGNHDDSALSFLSKLDRNVQQVVNQDRLGWVEQLAPEDVGWMKSLPYTLSIPSHNAIVVHAGFLPEVPVLQQQLYHLYTMRYVRRATRPKSPRPPSPPTSQAEHPLPPSQQHAPSSPPPSNTSWQGEGGGEGAGVESDAEEGGGEAGESDRGGVGGGGRKKRRGRWEVCAERAKGAVLWGMLWGKTRRKMPHVFFGHDAARGLQL